MPLDFEPDGQASHSYIPQTARDREAMLGVINKVFPQIKGVGDLFADIPEGKRFPTLHIPAALSESELRRHLGELSRANTVADEYGNRPSFLGGGTYRHHIPAAVNAIASRGEFTSPYTPYQFEIAQGTLLGAFEFQSFIARLTGMEVVNTGMYEGASATAEAVQMARRLTDRNKVRVADTVNPRILDVINTYSPSGGVEAFSVESDIKQIADQETAAVVVSYPDYFGVVEDLGRYAKVAHQAHAKLIVYSYPMALGLLEPPGNFGADIVVGDAQCIGNPLNFGGPSVGILAALEEDVRKMPGRLVGVAYDDEGRRGYALTLQAREQHIRRDKATSNVCTTGALVALRATMYLALTGPELQSVALENYRGTDYAMTQINQIPGFNVPDIDKPHFNEFVMTSPMDPDELNKRLLKEHDILGGIKVESPKYPNGLLLCVTEMNTIGDVNRLVKALGTVSGEEGYARIS